MFRVACRSALTHLRLGSSARRFAVLSTVGGICWKKAAMKTGAAFACGFAAASSVDGSGQEVHAAPVAADDDSPIEPAEMELAPHVPPAITRTYNAIARVELDADGFGGTQVRNGPWPFIRVKEGDTLEVHILGGAQDYMPEEAEFHVLDGSDESSGQQKPIVVAGKPCTATFLLDKPGLHVYHCSPTPVPEHVPNGVSGLIFVEPKEGLSPVDREYYVMQSELLLNEANMAKDLDTFAAENMKWLRSTKESEDRGVLIARKGERIRMFVGNGSPTLLSTFHVQGNIFEKLIWDGSKLETFYEGKNTANVLPSGSAIVEFTAAASGYLRFVLFRVDHGGVGYRLIIGDEHN